MHGCDKHATECKPGKEECYTEELLYHLFRRLIWFTFRGMFITTMHATQCNPPRSDVQDQSVYRADLKGLLKPETDGRS